MDLLFGEFRLSVAVVVRTFDPSGVDQAAQQRQGQQQEPAQNCE